LNRRAQVTIAVPLRSDDAELSPAARSVITFDNVTKVFQTRRATVRALDGIQLLIREKEFVCFIGPSGCGKSTILGLIAGLTRPTSGTLRIEGESIDVARQRHQIGLVFQDPVLLPWRTAYENVSLPLEVLKFSRNDRSQRVNAMIDLVGLSGFEQRYPHELSGGMRQRLGIARALSFDPQVLLMDEPFGALDAITRDKMSIELLRIWEQQQKTVVFVTHSISEAVLLSDRVVVLTPRPGRISAIIHNPLSRPRPLQMRDGPEFVALSRQLRTLLESE
jgi:NitT/TauT family transport system ATP-binding protein